MKIFFSLFLIAKLHTMYLLVKAEKKSIQKSICNVFICMTLNVIHSSSLKIPVVIFSIITSILLFIIMLKKLNYDIIIIIFQTYSSLTNSMV